MAPIAVNVTQSIFNNRFGAIHFKSGILWAGENNLVFSEDTGRTWKTSPWSNGSIRDISFRNKDTGAVVSDFGIFGTTDRGNSWTSLYSGAGGNTSYDRVAYNRSGTMLYALEDGNNTFTSSSDGGQTWQSLPVGANNSSFTIANEGTIYLLSVGGNPPGIRGGRTYSSSDSGNTWQRISGTLDADSYSIDMDSCDQNRLYAANENYGWAGDGMSKVYLSLNAGATWNIAFAHPIPYLAGSFASSANVHLAGTLADGMMRSTDQGNTWTNIGGPSNHRDSRNICTINDNIIFAVDTDGSIWGTFNSGGDSVRGNGILSISPRTLFASDTLACGTSSTQSSTFQYAGCKPPTVDHWSFEGADSLSYQVSSSNSDSLVVVFASQHSGLQHVKLLLTLTNGSVDSIILDGVGSPTYPLSMTTSDQKTDIVGGTVDVPLTISGLQRTEDIELVLHYRGDLDYLGSFDGSGTKVDLAGGQWQGRSKLRINGAAPGSAAALARFNVFADSTTSPQASFDSITVVTSATPCTYILPAAVTSIITPPSGCGTPILSQFLRKHALYYDIRPNPTTTGEVSIETSDDIGNVSVEVYDMLGAERMSTEAVLSAHTPLRLTLPAEAGMYYIRVRSQDGEFGSRVILQR